MLTATPWKTLPITIMAMVCEAARMMAAIMNKMPLYLHQQPYKPGQQDLQQPSTSARYVSVMLNKHVSSKQVMYCDRHVGAAEDIQCQAEFDQSKFYLHVDFTEHDEKCNSRLQ